MGAKAVTYDELVSEVLDSMGLINLPSPEDGWVELVDLVEAGKKRGKSGAQVRGALDRAAEKCQYERKKCGRRIFYREIK